MIEKQFDKLRSSAYECDELKESVHHLQMKIKEKLEAYAHNTNVYAVYFGPSQLYIDCTTKSIDKNHANHWIQNAEMNKIFAGLHGHSVRNRYLHWVTDFVNLIFVSVIGKLAHKNKHYVVESLENYESTEEFMNTNFIIFTYFFAGYTMYFLHNVSTLRWQVFQGELLEDFFTIFYIAGILMYCVFLPLNTENDDVHNGLSYSYIFHIMVMIMRSTFHAIICWDNSYAVHYCVQQIITYVIAIGCIIMTFFFKDENDVQFYFYAFFIIFIVEAASFQNAQANTAFLTHNLGIFCCLVIGELVLQIANENFEESKPHTQELDLLITGNIFLAIVVCFSMTYFIFLDLFIGFHEDEGLNSDFRGIPAFLWLILTLVASFLLFRLSVFIMIYIYVSKNIEMEVARLALMTDLKNNFGFSLELKSPEHLMDIEEFQYCISGMMTILPMIFLVVWIKRQHYDSWNHFPFTNGIRVFSIAIMLGLGYYTNETWTEVKLMDILYPFSITIFLCVVDIFCLQYEAVQHEHEEHEHEHGNEHENDEEDPLLSEHDEEDPFLSEHDKEDPLFSDHDEAAKSEDHPESRPESTMIFN